MDSAKYAYKQYIYARRFLRECCLLFNERNTTEEEKMKLYKEYMKAAIAYAQLSFCDYKDTGKGIDCIPATTMEIDGEYFIGDISNL